MPMIRTVAILIVILTASPSFAAVLRRGEALMGTVCEIAIADSSGARASVDAAFAEARRIEAFLSTWRPDSELSRLNRGEVTEVSPELAGLLADALQWSRTTEEAFTLLAGPLIQLWRTREEGAVPSAADIDTARRQGALSNITIDGQKVGLHGGAVIGEGAFGKGYALDRMIARLPSPAMIDFGGQIIVRGTLRVQIAHPEQRDRAVLALPLTGESISTSSGSEKTFEIGGTRFTHIINPRTGRALPPRGSVSVIARSATTADILSTALYVMGVEEGLRWAGEHGVEAIFITPDQQIRISAPARRRVRELAVLDPHFHLQN